MRLLFFATILLTQSLSAQYTISGKVNLGPNWQPKIFLAAIDKLSDYYRTSPDMIVNMAIVNPDGTFSMQGDNLPEEKLFYRIYLMKKQNTDYDACLYVGGEDHNFAHLILDNHSELQLLADTSSLAPFANYHILGEEENVMMEQLSRIVYPRFYFYRIKFPTELKFSEDKLHQDLKNFADTSQYPMVALAAVNNMDFDEYFESDRAFYTNFGNRLQRDLSSSPYTPNFLLKLQYYANEAPRGNYGYKTGFWSLFVIWLLTLMAWWKNTKKAPPADTGSATGTAGISDLTLKESEILALIGQGKSNKEIASHLFIEVSTVKTHINKIYSKTGVSNRKEARALGKTLQSVGV